MWPLRHTCRENEQMPYRRGDVVTVPIPYDDQPGKYKPRPAVVVSAVSYQTEVSALIVAKVTSSPCKMSIDHAIADWKSAGLKKPSWVRIKLFTVDVKLASTVGTLTRADFDEVVKRLRNTLDLN